MDPITFAQTFEKSSVVPDPISEFDHFTHCDSGALDALNLIFYLTKSLDFRLVGRKMLYFNFVVIQDTYDPKRFNPVCGQVLRGLCIRVAEHGPLHWLCTDAHESYDYDELLQWSGNF